MRNELTLFPKLSIFFDKYYIVTEKRESEITALIDYVISLQNVSKISSEIGSEKHLWNSR